MSHSDPDPPIPERYTVVEELQRTAQTVRLHARDQLTQRDVELEFPGPGARALLRSSGERAALLREASLRAKVTHPRLQTLLDVLPVPKSYVLVLDRSPQGLDTLADVLAKERHRLSAEEVASLGIDLADVLGCMHAAGIVHRAVQAQNLLLDAERRLVSLTGCCFAKQFGELGRSSLPHGRTDIPHLERAALPQHVAPEMLRNHPADARSDVFALGCVLYEAMTGRTPFPIDAGRDPADLDREPPDPRSFVADLPAGLVDVVKRCVRGQSARRFQSMADVQVALRKVRDELGRAVAAPSVWPRPVMLVAVVSALVSMWFAFGGAPADGRGGFGIAALSPEESSTLTGTYTRSWALLIGIDYHGTTLPALRTAENDVNAVGQKLLELGWQREHIHTLVGPRATAQAIRDHLDGFVLDGVGPNDQVLIYFAGHGKFVQSVGNGFYLVPADGTAAKPPERKGKRWIDSDEVRAAVQGSRAKHCLLVLDCCYSGAAGFGGAAVHWVPRERTLHDDVTAVEQSIAEPRRSILTSTSAWQVAPDGVGDHSPFATVFLDMLTRACATPVSEHQIVSAVHARLGGATSDQRADLRELSEDSSGTFWFLRPK